MRALVPCALALLTSAPTWASPNQKRLEHRAEADQLVAMLVEGSNLDGNVARVKFLGEEDYVAGELAVRFARLTEDRPRQHVSYALSRLVSHAAEASLVHMLKDSDAVIRMNAAQGLGYVQTRAWTELLPLLRDPSLGVRAEAARALGAAHARPAGRSLLAAARTEAEPEVRSLMLVAVGDAGDRTAVPVLAGFLTSPSETTRWGAARALCHLGAPEGLAFVRNLLVSTDRVERRNGLSLLEGAPSRSIAPLAHPLLNDPDLVLAAKAARILYQGGETRMLDWLVLAASRAQPADRDIYERELEPLRVTQAQRRAIVGNAEKK